MIRRFAPAVLLGTALSLIAVRMSQSQEPPLARLDRELQAIAALPGEPSQRQAAGVTRQGLLLHTLESSVPLDGPERRVVLIGGLDGDQRSVDAVLAAARWFKTAAPAALRRRLSLAVLPCGNPEGLRAGRPENDTGQRADRGYPPADGFFLDPAAPERRYIWRWIPFQGPDRVIEVRADRPGEAPTGRAPDSLIAALAAERSGGERVPGLGPAAGTVIATGDGTLPAGLPKELERALSGRDSGLHSALRARLSRSPLDVAAQLAEQYPRAPAIGYIPATAWSATLRLSELRREPRLRVRVLEAMRPYLAGERPALTGPPDVVKLAGHIVFADLAVMPEVPEEARASARRIALDAAVRYRPETATDPARYGRYWTDDMYMQCCLLGRAGAHLGDSASLELLGRSLRLYAARLQRPDGLFVHAPEGPHCWGRGNGFASLGLMEGLTALPATHPERAGILAAYRLQMAALLRHQTPEGTWRQVVDRPGSYREITATAMNLTAMARGVRLGWLSPEYREVVRRAWAGLSARIADDGALTDVCTGTGSGPTLRYYYDRAAIAGFDDRGGAMSLLAAVEVAQLPR